MYKLLEACRSAEIKRYVYASTVYVYSRDGGFIVAATEAADGYCKVEKYIMLVATLDYIFNLTVWFAYMVQGLTVEMDYDDKNELEQKMI